MLLDNLSARSDIYEFHVRPPAEDVSVSIIVRRGRGVALTASFAGKRSALTDANLLRAWAGNPLLTLKVIAGIHWEALRMWLKGVRYLGRRRSAGFQPASGLQAQGHRQK